MSPPQQRSLRDVVYAGLELRALEAEDDCAAAISEARAALHVLRLLRLLEVRNAAMVGAGEGADAIAADAFAQLNEDLCEALRAQSVVEIDRVASAVREELGVRGAGGSEDGGDVGSCDEGGGGRSLLIDGGDSLSRRVDLRGKTVGHSKATKRGRRSAPGFALWLRRAIMPGRRRTTHERAACANVLAWALAFFGLGAVWMWFTKQFIVARREPVVQRELIEIEELVVPTLTICDSLGHSMPTFHDFPTAKFLGSPWLTVRLYEDISRGGTVEYPATKGVMRDTAVTSGDVKRCEREMAALDPMVHISRARAPGFESALAGCRGCVTVEPPRPVIVKKVSSHGVDLAQGLRMEVVVSRVPQYCFYPQSRDVNSRVFEAMHYEISDNLDELIERGVLDLNGADPEKRTTVFLGTDPVRSILNFVPDGPPTERAPDFEGPDSFACGVYLFSGLWYPTTVERVQWIYNRNGTGWWERNNAPGFGPYFNTTSSFDTAGFSAGLPSRNPRSDPTVYTGIPTLEVFATDVNEPLRASLNTSYRVALLQSNTRTAVRLYNEVDIGGRAVYGSRGQSSIRLESLRATQQDSRSNFFRLQLSVSFGSFVIPKIVTRRAYELSGYMADLANFFDIFIGQSVFSLVVMALTAAVIGRLAEVAEVPVSSAR